MYHKVILIGNLGQDPEMRYTPTGTAVTSFSVATTNRISKQTNPDCPEGWKESYNGRNWELTTWWRITAWRNLAELCNQFLAKGRTVYIEGEIRGEAQNGSQNPRIWTGSDGVARASFEVTARTIKFLGGRGERTEGGAAYEGEEEPPPGFVEENDIPF
ncbi:MAG: single-stranded DNA-binding protein [Anaerolineae bacterium]|nr:single-stranded DNA-binding protein [Anaerolineae bacterium]